jgi:parallel beta-helix repeat protein
LASAGNSHHCLVDGNIFSNAGDGVLCLAGARHHQVSGNNIFDNPGLVTK